MNKFLLVPGLILVVLGVGLPLTGLVGASVVPPYTTTLTFYNSGGVPVPGVSAIFVASPIFCNGVSAANGQLTCGPVQSTGVEYAVIYTPSSTVLGGNGVPYQGGTYTYTPNTASDFNAIYLQDPITTTSSTTTTTTTSTSSSSVPVTATTVTFYAPGAVPIPGVTAQLNQAINGVTTTIASGMSGANGQLVFQGFSVSPGTQLSVSYLGFSFEGKQWNPGGYSYTLNNPSQFNPIYPTVSTTTTSSTSTTGSTTSTTTTTTSSTCTVNCTPPPTSGLSIWNWIAIAGAILSGIGLLLPESIKGL